MGLIMMKNKSSVEVISEVLVNDVNILVKKYTSVDEVKRLIQNLQNRKHLLKKKKAVGKCAQTDVDECIKAIDRLQDVKLYLEPKKKTAMSLTQAEIDLLSYVEVEKAIKSVQTKKTMSSLIEDEVEREKVYEEVLAQEALLKAHRNEVAPLDDNVIRKSTVSDFISTVEALDITKEQVLEMLADIIK